jgi:hypothetical protein
MKKKKKDVKTDGYSARHLSQLIRRKMMQKDHGDQNKYDRNDKSWKNELDNE